MNEWNFILILLFRWFCFRLCLSESYKLNSRMHSIVIQPFRFSIMVRTIVTPIAPPAADIVAFMRLFPTKVMPTRSEKVNVADQTKRAYWIVERFFSQLSKLL